MFRLWWLRSIARNTGKMASGIDKAMPGAGLINAASIVVGLVSFTILLAVGFAVFAPIGVAWLGAWFAVGFSVAIAWGFNAWMLEGLRGIDRFQATLKHGKPARPVTYRQIRRKR